MKKKITLLLLLTLISGCGNKAVDNQTTTQTTTELTTEITTLTETGSQENQEKSTYEAPTYSAEEKKERYQAAEKQVEELKKQYGEKLFVSYDTTYAVGFPDEQWGGIEDDTLTTFTKNNMTITSMHLDEVDLPTFGNVKAVMPKTRDALEKQYSKNEDTKNYKVLEFDFTSGEYDKALAVIEPVNEEQKYMLTLNIASDNNAFIICGYCDTSKELKEIKDILQNNFYIF